MDGSVVFARWRQCAPHLKTCFLGPTRVQTTNGISIIQTFLHSSRQNVPILYNRQPFPPQNCPFLWGIWTPIQYMLPWVHSSPQHKRHLDWFSRFCGAHYCHVRQTDRPRNSVAIGRIYVRRTVMRPKNQQLIVIYDKQINNKALYKIHHLYFKQQFKQS